jgi:hypothetical protein
MKKAILEIQNSNKKFFRVFAQFGIGHPDYATAEKNISKEKAAKLVKEFYDTLCSKMKNEDSMPESYISVFAYTEKNRYYESAPIVDYHFKQL